MQTTQAQTELEQAQAILEEAQGALQAAESDRAGGQREKDFARRDAGLAQREQQLEEIGIQQAEVASALEHRTAELRRQLVELERQQAALLAHSKATQQQSQPQTAGFTEEGSQEILETSPGDTAAGEDRQRTAAAPSSMPVDDAASLDTYELPFQEEASATKPKEQAAAEDPADEEEEPKPVARAARTQRVTDDDQSIEQYMAGLLIRMRGGSDADVVIAPERKPARQEESPPLVPEVKPLAAPVKPVASAHQQRVIDVHMAPVEMERRSTVAECNDLAAMRELANSHARIAIGTHGKKQLLKNSLGAWAGGIAVATASLVALCLLPTEAVVMKTACLTGFVLSGYWINRAVTVTRQLLTSDAAVEIPSRAVATQVPEDSKPT